MGLPGNNALIERILENAIEKKSKERNENVRGIEKINLSLLNSVKEAEDMFITQKIDQKKEKNGEYFRFICGEK
jgi:hypothetical protein